MFSSRKRTSEDNASLEVDDRHVSTSRTDRCFLYPLNFAKAGRRFAEKEEALRRHEEAKRRLAALRKDQRKAALLIQVVLLTQEEQARRDERYSVYISLYIAMLVLSTIRHAGRVIWVETTRFMDFNVSRPIYTQIDDR